MKGKGIAVGLTFSCLLLAACHSHAPSQLVPACFFIPPRATNILHGSEYGGNVNYDVNEPFPATGTIKSIKSHLRSLGWEPKERALISGSVTSQVRGWGSYEDVTTKPEQDVRVWSGEWQDRAGAVVIYSLSYRNPVADSRSPGLSPANLHVFIALMPPTLAKDLETTARKQREQEGIKDSYPEGIFSITLPSGSTRWVVYSGVSAVSPPADHVSREYTAQYLTRQDWADARSVWREIDAVWNVLRPMADKSGVTEATIYACEEPGCKANTGSSYRKDTAGQWIKR